MRIFIAENDFSDYKTRQLMANTAASPNGRGINDDSSELRLNSPIEVQPLSTIVSPYSSYLSLSRLNYSIPEVSPVFFKVDAPKVENTSKFEKITTFCKKAFFTSLMSLLIVSISHANAILPVDAILPVNIVDNWRLPIDKLPPMDVLVENYDIKVVDNITFLPIPSIEKFEINTPILTKQLAPIAISKSIEIPDTEESAYEKAIAAITTAELDDIRTNAAEQGKMYFLKFGAKWCSPCKIMNNSTFVNEKVVNYIDAHYLKLDVDVDNLDGMSLKQKYGVKLLPTIIIFNAEGEEVARFEETMSARKMLAQLKEYNKPEYNQIAAAKKQVKKINYINDIISDITATYVIAER